MIMSADDYGFLYGQLESSKIPNDIHTKLMEGEDLTAEEETRIKAIIEREKPKKPIRNVGFGMITYKCPVCGAKAYQFESFCDNCHQKFDWRE